MRPKQILVYGLILSFTMSFSFENSFAESGIVDVYSFDVSYDIENGVVDSIFLDPDFLELVVTMDTSDDGIIKITIPRAVLDSKFGLTDDIFFILVDSFETDYVELSSNNSSRTLAIPFFGGDSTIEIIGTDALTPIASDSEIVIPPWIKSNAGWWSDGLIGDSDFVSGIQYLINEKIMTIPPGQSGESSSQEIPPWIKSNAGWWSDGLIGDSDFVSGIQYLISNGIMQI
jgi:hypothetical protein